MKSHVNSSVPRGQEDLELLLFCDKTDDNNDSMTR